MPRILYDLAGAEPARRFSPYCWRTRMALAHKGLEVTTIPWRFTDKAAIAFSGQGQVPVLVEEDGTTLTDSWAIAEALEDRYPDGPSLFGGAKAETRFIAAWADSQLHPWVARLVVRDILDVLAPEDVGYFRESREKRFGTTLEAFTANREALLPEFRKALHPIRMTLRAQPFLCGTDPGYADYCVFGAFQWARCTSPLPLLETDDPIHAWRGRLLDLHGGLARRAPNYDM